MKLKPKIQGKEEHSGRRGWGWSCHQAASRFQSHAGFLMSLMLVSWCLCLCCLWMFFIVLMLIIDLVVSVYCLGPRGAGKEWSRLWNRDFWKQVGFCSDFWKQNFPFLETKMKSVVLDFWKPTRHSWLILLWKSKFCFSTPVEKRGKQEAKAQVRGIIFLRCQQSGDATNSSQRCLHD